MALVDKQGISCVTAVKHDKLHYQILRRITADHTRVDVIYNPLAIHDMFVTKVTVLSIIHSVILYGKPIILVAVTIPEPTDCK